MIEEGNERTIRAVLVDDESLARQRLRRLLGSYGDFQAVGEASGGVEAIERIESLQPDLIFLDVMMPDLNGFEVLRALDGDRSPLVIFVTAYDRYAVEAFEVRAIDYLLKPIHRDRFREALGRARERIENRRESAAAVREFVHSPACPEQGYIQRLPVRSKGRILILPIEKVAALRLDQGLVFVHCESGDFATKYTTFSQLEKRLDPSEFLRVHRQGIVSLSHIREVRAFDNSTARLVLDSGGQLDVSRSHLKNLRRILQW